MTEGASRRRANFFRGTANDPNVHTVSDSALDNALIVVGASIDAQAKTDGYDITSVQRQRALSVAQRLLRALPRDQLQNISAQSGLLKSIADQSLAVAPVTDPRAVTLMRLEERGQGVAASETASGIFGRRGLDGSGASSFARLAEIGGVTSTEMARTIEQARYEAIRLGIPWAANNPDLLRLGAGAIKAIAEVNLKEQSYKRLTNDAHFGAKDVVTFADYAKSKGIKDANQAAGAVADFVQLGQDQAEQQRLKDAVVGFMKASNEAGVAPHDPAAQQRLRQAGATYRETAREVAKRSPDAAETTRRLEDANRIPQEFRATAATAEVRNDGKVVKADVRDDAAARRGTEDDAALTALAAPDQKPAAAASAQSATDKKAAPSAAQPTAKPAAPK